MSVHTVELLPDARLDEHIRSLWQRLHAAGLPSLATHRHPTNRPHLTLLKLDTLDGLPPLPLPIPAELGPVRLLGRALVRPVASPWERLPLPARADWVPHVSLALNVRPEHHAAALALLTGLPPQRGAWTAARSYDTERRTVTALPTA